jgi:hypothetical protein
MKLVCDLSSTSAPHRPRREWAPETLFRAGEAGTWFDPADLGSLFQDAAGTLPVTASGQPVGRMLDKSGNGNHASQPVSAARPTYQAGDGLHWLAFDGVDDFFVTTAIDLTGTDKLNVFAAVRKPVQQANKDMLVELSPAIQSNFGTFNITAPYSSVANTYGFISSGTIYSTVLASSLAPPVTNVLTATGRISPPFANLRVNGAPGVVGTASQGTGNYGNYPLYIGARAGTSLRFTGNLFGLILRGAASSAAEIGHAERYFAKKSGVTL